MKKSFIVFFIVLFSVLYGIKRPKPFIQAEIWNFVSNSEYVSNSYKIGEPYFGTQIKTNICLEPAEGLRISGGILLRKFYGDEDFLSDIHPLFKMQYKINNFTFVFGDLNDKNNHGLPDVLLSEQAPFKYEFEEGIQVLYSSEKLNVDFWGTYPALNTPEHKEHLCVGSSNSFNFNNITLDLQMYISHYGGQLYHPEGQFTRENYTGKTGFRYKLKNIEFEQSAVASKTTESREDGYKYGIGSISGITWQNKYLNVVSQYFIGKNYETWLGNEFYFSNEPYYYLELNKSMKIAEVLDFEIGIRADFVEVSPMEYFKSSNHIAWLNLVYEY
jgi:hypothetical protein